MKVEIKKKETKVIEKELSIIEFLKEFSKPKYGDISWFKFNEDISIKFINSDVDICRMGYTYPSTILRFNMEHLPLGVSAKLVEDVLKQETKDDNSNLKMKVNEEIQEEIIEKVEIKDLIEKYKETEKDIHKLPVDENNSLKISIKNYKIEIKYGYNTIGEVNIRDISSEFATQQVEIILKAWLKWIDGINMRIVNMEELQKIPEGGIGKTGTFAWGMPGCPPTDDGYEFSRDIDLMHMRNILEKSIPTKWRKEYGKDMKKGQVFKRAKIGDRFYWETNNEFHKNEKMKLKKFYISAVARKDLKNATKWDFINNLEITLEIK